MQGNSLCSAFCQGKYTHAYAFMQERNFDIYKHDCFLLRMNPFYGNVLCCAEKIWSRVRKLGRKSQRNVNYFAWWKSVYVHNGIWVTYCQQCDLNIVSVSPTKSGIKSTWFTKALVWVDSFSLLGVALWRQMQMELGEERLWKVRKTPEIFRSLEDISRFPQVWIWTVLQGEQCCLESVKQENLSQAW